MKLTPEQEAEAARLAASLATYGGGLTRAQRSQASRSPRPV